MKKEKEKSTYLGGESDSPEKVTPKMYENFLTKKALFGVLAILLACAVLVMLI